MKVKFFEAVATLTRRYPNAVENVFASYGLNGVRNMILHVNSHSKKVPLLPKVERLFYFSQGPARYDFLRYMAEHGEEIYREYPQGYKMLSEIAMFCYKRAILYSLGQRYPRMYAVGHFSHAEWNFYRANAERCLDMEDTMFVARKVVENSTLSGEPKINLCWKCRLDAPPSLLEIREFSMLVLQQ